MSKQNALAAPCCHLRRDRDGDCVLHFSTAALVAGRQPRLAHIQIQRCKRQDFPTESMADNNSATVCLHLAASGVLARRASSARSIALSTVCQSAAARGFNPASASSHWVSRSLIRALAPARSPSMLVANVNRPLSASSLPQ